MRFISQERPTPTSVAAQAESALRQLDTISRSGIVPETDTINPNRSHFLILDGVLCIYNRTDGTVKPITVGAAI